MRKHSHGFTLIELLVVIAIIAILAAILFPVFSAAKASGYKASCMANLRSIGRALDLYRDSYGGRNCSIWQAKQQGYAPGHSSWHFSIIPYLGQKVARTGTDNVNQNEGRKTVFNCPAAGWLKGKAEIRTPANANKHQGFSYEMNETSWNDTGHGCMSAACYQGRSGEGQVDSAFRRPGQTIFIAEGMGYPYTAIGYADGNIVDNEKRGFDDASYKNSPFPNEDITLCDPNRIGMHGGSWSKMYNIRVSHAGKANLLFYDGHVECRSKTKGYNWIIW